MFENAVRAFVLLIVLTFVSFQSFASSISVVENTSFIRDKGKPKIETLQFKYKAAELFQLTVFNGGVNNQYCRVSSAVIKLNNQSTFTPREFNQQIHLLSTGVVLQQENILTVELRSRPGCGIELSISGEEPTPPLNITSMPPLEAVTEQLYQYQLSTNIELDWSLVASSFLASPIGMTITQGMIEWTPTNEQVGEHNVIIEIEHPEYGKTSQSFVINTDIINQAPVAENITVHMSEDSISKFSLLANDPQSDPINYLITSQPEHGHIELTDALISYTPIPDYFGVDSFEYQASDGQVTSNIAIVTINISPINDSPIIISEPLLSSVENVSYSYLVQGIDVDGDALTYQLDTFPTGMTIDGNSGLVSWLPNSSDIGEHLVVITVTDTQGLSSNQSYTVTVQNINESPSIVSTAITSAHQNSPYVYDVVATDPDVDDSLTYSLSTAPVGMVIDPDSGQINWIPTAEQVGEHSVTLVVSDLAGLMDSQVFSVIVSHVNNAPNIISTPTLSAIVDQLYQYNVVANDNDGDNITYELNLSPQGMYLDNTSGQITWVPV